MAEGKLKPTSINVAIRAWNSFLGWAYKEDHFKNRVKPIELLKVHQKVVPTLTEAEVQRLVQHKPLRHERRVHAMMYLILDTGLRLGECLRIERRDVDFENFLLTVRHGKGNKERKVPISANGRKVLFLAKVYWHLLRHTFGTLFIRNGGNVADLQRIMGHAAITTTMLYVHNQTEHFVQAHNSLSPLARAACR